MRDAAWVAEAAGGELVAGDPTAPGPRRAVVDSRGVEPGDLFVGLHGANADGSRFAADALAAGAWGALVGPARAGELAESGGGAPVIAAQNTLTALAALARAWRHELGCRVVGVTGSTGKTSTKDILAALLAPHLRTHRNRENWNTEIGLPLTVLEAEPGTDVLVLEMAMRGEGQIAELAAIAEPDVGLIVNVGPVHLELLGTIERVAAAKAELIRDLPAHAVAVVPAGEALLEEHLRDDIETITFGPDGDVRLESFADGRAVILARGERVELELPFDEDYNLANTVAAVAAASALGVTPSGRLDVAFSALRGEIVELDGGVTVVNDCYNANPMSMRAALEHLAASSAERRIAVLGGMAELGESGPRFHHEIGHLADALGIDVLITVGELALPYADAFGGELHQVGDAEEAGALLEEIALPGDRVLVKGSRSVGLERVLA
ncbi:MAG TPA: UDP-N-acetylmuramoyl-tripeptide--D-alanyl-D-alanine ligase [Thermoleophilaceae bacterium]|nr:UDP-N-acetylmuramoyl-tripeptide--D-alanyl-D-alanine ligase [Thermoleophilaceae bacterium]